MTQVVIDSNTKNPLKLLKQNKLYSINTSNKYFSSRFNDSSIFKFQSNQAALIEEIASLDEYPNEDINNIYNAIQRHVRYGAHRFSSRFILFITKKTEDGIFLESILFVINRIPYNVTDILLRSPSSSSKSELAKIIGSIPDFYKEKIYNNDELGNFLNDIDFVNFDERDALVIARYNYLHSVVKGIYDAKINKKQISKSIFLPEETINFSGGMGVFIPNGINIGFNDKSKLIKPISKKNRTVFKRNQNSISINKYVPPNKRAEFSNNTYIKFPTNKRFKHACKINSDHIFYNYEPPCLTACREVEEEIGVPYNKINILTYPKEKNINDLYKSKSVKKFMHYLTRNIRYKENVIKYQNEDKSFNPLFNDQVTVITVAESMNVKYFSLNFIGLIDENDIINDKFLSSKVSIFGHNSIGKFRTGKFSSIFPTNKKAKGSETDHILSVPISKIMKTNLIKFNKRSNNINQKVYIPKKVHSVIKKIITTMSDENNNYRIYDNQVKNLKNLEISKFNI